MAKKCRKHLTRNCPICESRQATVERGVVQMVEQACIVGIYNPEDVSEILSCDWIDKFPTHVLQGVVRWLRKNHLRRIREYEDVIAAESMLQRWELITVYRLMGWGGAEVAARDPRDIRLDREGRARAKSERAYTAKLEAKRAKPGVTGEFETAAALSNGIQG